jgi:hypothetical protein
MPPGDVTDMLLMVGPMFPPEGHGLNRAVDSMVMALIVVLILAVVKQDIRLRRRRT